MSESITPPSKKSISDSTSNSSSKRVDRSDDDDDDDEESGVSNRDSVEMVRYICIHAYIYEETELNGKICAFLSCVHPP